VTEAMVVNWRFAGGDGDSIATISSVIRDEMRPDLELVRLVVGKLAAPNRKQ
jgi:orotate phosphoribosyltransferase-like protein